MKIPRLGAFPLEPGCLSSFSVCDSCDIASYKDFILKELIGCSVMEISRNNGGYYLRCFDKCWNTYAVYAIQLTAAERFQFETAMTANYRKERVSA